MELKDIEIIQNIIKKDIKESLRKGKLEKTIQLIDCFADATQRINNILRDDDVESAIKELSERYIDSTNDIANGEDKTIVLYDQIGTTICLGVQYLRALAACGYKIVYIFENFDFNAGIAPGLLKDIKKYCTEFHEFNSRKVFQGGKFLGNTIREIIIKANPSKIIVHPQATGALGMAIMFSIKGARKFRIVPGDHHFYIGFDCFDRFIEFRPYGWSTAIYERRIPANKIYNLSYYPIIDEFVPFQGFPEATKGKVILSSGGATYKFQGSDDFYTNLESILTKTDNAVFVFMGAPSAKLVQLSQKESVKDKIFFLGYRKDFAAVMKNIDILVNSYPFSGGLFCQTAARFSKPILAYTSEPLLAENSVEDLLGSPQKENRITHTDKESFINHAIKLIESAEYRQQWGDYAHTLQQTDENFNRQLGEILNETFPTLGNKEVAFVDRTVRIEQNVEMRTTCEPDHFMPISRLYRLKTFYKFRALSSSPLNNWKYVVYNILASFPAVRKLCGK